MIPLVFPSCSVTSFPAAASLRGYTHRYLPLTPTDRTDMLKIINPEFNSFDDFYSALVPKTFITDNIKSFDLPEAQTEQEIYSDMKMLSERNLHAQNTSFFIGGGLYNHYIPSIVDNIISRSEFLTAYTPYQPEVSQGTLQVLFEMQTQFSRLSGMEFSNGGMYDGSTAVAEAVLWSHRIHKGKRSKVITSYALHPHYQDILKTTSEQVGTYFLQPGSAPKESLMTESSRGYDTQPVIDLLDEDTTCVVVQNPNFFGYVYKDVDKLIEAAHKKGVHVVHAFNEPLAFGALKRPGDIGVDICAGEGQSLGIPMNLGGPTVGLLSGAKKHIRSAPGRIVGETTDSDGRRAFVLTLGTREQHIRREKATSNICTSSGLCVLAFSSHLATLGEYGIQALAKKNHDIAVDLYQQIQSNIPSVKLLTPTFFNEFTLAFPNHVNTENLVEKAVDHGLLLGIPSSKVFTGTTENGFIHHPLDQWLTVAATEQTTPADIAKWIEFVKSEV